MTQTLAEPWRVTLFAANGDSLTVQTDPDAAIREAWEVCFGDVGEALAFVRTRRTAFGYDLDAHRMTRRPIREFHVYSPGSSVPELFREGRSLGFLGAR